MMRIGIFTILLLIISQACTNKPHILVESKYNLNFEENIFGNELPDYWFKSGTANYIARKDSNCTFVGNYSSVIYSKSDVGSKSFGCVVYKLPAYFEGRKINLRGFMKTENVERGFAGITLRIDGDEGTLEYENMHKRNISGTQDWEEFSITLPFHNNAKNIVVGGILTGKGKVWFDNFKVSIDGKDISSLKPDEKKLSKAALDVEFDKGSGISIKNLNGIQIKKLHKLCKVWGFVKYHHPEIANGNVNIDYELFRVLPKVLNTATLADSNSEINKWIKRIGKISGSNNNAALSLGKIKLKPETKWIEDQNYLGSELSNTLVQIRNNKTFYTHYHVEISDNVGKPIFLNEKGYKKMSFDDDGFKLLSLFRYWNIIQYYFPYRHLVDADWHSVLNEFIPKLIDSDDELGYKLSMLELIGKIQDTHANIWMDDDKLNDFWGLNGVPAEVKLIQNKLLVTRVLNENNGILKAGDIIQKIDGKKVGDIIKEKIKYCPASNLVTQHRDICKKLLRTNNSSLQVVVKRGNKLLNKELVCEKYSGLNFSPNDISSHKLLKGNIAYLYPGKLKKDKIHDIMKKFKNTRGLIIDLRCELSGFIVLSLEKYLMPKPVEFVKFTNGSVQNPGLFTFTKAIKTGEENKDYYKGKLVVLINEKTQSSAEYTTMALRRAPRAVVVGSTTAGANGNVSSIVLPGNIHTKISSTGVYYPNGKETQRVGIIPDIKMKPTILGIQNGKDELLVKAIRLINN